MSWFPLVFALGLGAVAFAIRLSRFRTIRIAQPYAIAVFIAVALFAMGGSAGYFFLSGLRPDRPPQSFPSVAVTDSSAQTATKLLTTGTKLPSLKAEGWLNGDP